MVRCYRCRKEALGRSAIMASRILEHVLPEARPVQCCCLFSCQPVDDDELIYNGGRFVTHSTSRWCFKPSNILFQRAATWTEVNRILELVIGKRLAGLVFTEAGLEKFKKRSKPLLIERYNRIKHKAIELEKVERSAHKTWLLIKFYELYLRNAALQGKFLVFSEEAPNEQQPRVKITKPCFAKKKTVIQVIDKNRSKMDCVLNVININSSSNCVFLEENRIKANRNNVRHVKKLNGEVFKKRTILVYNTDINRFSSEQQFYDEKRLTGFIGYLFTGQLKWKRFDHVNARQISCLILDDFETDNISFVRLQHLLRKVARATAKKGIFIKNPDRWDELRQLVRKPFSLLTAAELNQLSQSANKDVDENWQFESRIEEEKTMDRYREKKVHSSQIRRAPSPSSNHEHSDSSDSD
jgi:hypothetical protein